MATLPHPIRYPLTVIASDGAMRIRLTCQCHFWASVKAPAR